MKTKCVECEADIGVLDDAVQGEIVSCPDCGLEFEVVGFKNGVVELKAAEKVGEDWGE